MRFGWIELLLAILATVVLTLCAVRGWDAFRTWRINREYSPDRRQGPRGRRREDQIEPRGDGRRAQDGGKDSPAA